MYPEYAEIHDPKFLRKPTDATYKGSPYIKELQKATLVHVERTITVKIEERNHG